jgi:RNA polymerase sigma factor (sigma-70 family)
MQSIQQMELLVQRCRSGDDAAWGALVRSFTGFVSSIAWKSGLTDDEASDVLQQTFVALLTALPQIEDPRKLPSWIARTAGRECVRTKARRLRRLTDAAGEAPDREPSPEETVIRSEQIEEMKVALSQLPMRQIVVLHGLFLEGKSYEQIAQEYHMPHGAIGPTRSRALAQLRSELAGRR